MLEHLTFRASKHHQNNDSGSEADDVDRPEFDFVHSLEAEGLQFGAHQNAYTTFDETVYFLHVPLKRNGDSSSSDGDEDGGERNEGGLKSKDGRSDEGPVGDESANESEGMGANENDEGDAEDGASDDDEDTSSAVDYSSGGLLARCVGALASLVLNARLTDGDVEAERTIVVEEWRSRQVFCSTVCSGCFILSYVILQ